MAYVKKWAPRSFNELELREPSPVSGPPGTVSRIDATELVASLRDIDCVYFDPPYNQHSYYSNYHIWETLVRWDKPEHYGIACKRLDCKTTKSRFNSRPEAWAAFAELVSVTHAPWILTSFNNEGYHDVEDVQSLLAEKGHVATLTTDFKRYVGAQIGIYNPSGAKVGAVSHLHNKEMLFVVGPDAAAVEEAVAGLAIGPGSPADSHEAALFT